jgi:hypothetical protein
MTDNKQGSGDQSRASENIHTRVWKIAISVAILVLALRVVLLAANIGSGSTASTLLALLVIVVILVALFLVPLQMIRAYSVAQFNSVVQSNPGALVIPASRAPNSKTALRAIGLQANLPLFMTWVVTAEELQVWRGGNRAKLLATVPWTQIQYVALNDNIRLGSGPKRSAAIDIEWFNFTGEFSFFLRRPPRPMYPAPVEDVQKAVDAINPFVPQREN